MATIILSLSAKTDKETSQHEVLIRFFHGRINQRAKTNVFVHPEYWNEEQQTIIIPNWRVLTDEKKQIKDELQNKCDQLNKIVSLVQSSFQAANKNTISKDWLKSLVYDFNFPKTDEDDEQQTSNSFFDLFTLYIDESDFSLPRKKNMKVVWRTLRRFELYKGMTLSFDTITDDTLRMIEKFYKEEHKICESKSYSKILATIPESRTPKPRGKNSINSFMCRLRAFLYWAIRRDYTTNDPFRKYKIVECVYGTPIYITKEERNHLYHFDFSDNPRLARQRDVFVFQCLIGCRVSDLWAMTKSNVIDGAIEYIPNKTKNDDATRVRVPLNSIAKEILKRYEDYQGKTLLPLTAQQHYNKDIKEIFRIAGLTRIVTVINPTTREEEQHPICDIASSHMARRCFIGNLYKQVKDPNAIGALSGHVEGSRAFSRYREIDEDVKKELVTLLE